MSMFIWGLLLFCSKKNHLISNCVKYKKAQSSVSRDVFVAVLCSSALHHTNFSNLSSMMRTFFSILILLAAFFISAFVNFPPNVSWKTIKIYSNESIQCSELSDTSSGLKDDQYFEWIISIFLLLLLIYLENRGYEISHRLNFKVIKRYTS